MIMIAKKFKTYVSQGTFLGEDSLFLGEVVFFPGEQSCP
jgi:hypothetical protein